MPVHDWHRIEANAFHHFHQVWTVGIAGSLNSGLLPEGYSAMVEYHAGRLAPDVLTLERRASPDPLRGRGGVLTFTPPKTRLVRHATSALAARANRIVIRHRLDEIVCILEVVSPGNKSGRSALREFVEKAIDFLGKGVHLLIIDLLPPTPRDPQGMHKAIWDEFQDEPFELPPSQPFTLAAYVAGDFIIGRPPTAYVETIGVGDVLPDMPAHLEADVYVPVPLEATYQAAWAACPAALRTWVETGKVPGEE